MMKHLRRILCNVLDIPNYRNFRLIVRSQRTAANAKIDQCGLSIGASVHQVYASVIRGDIDNASFVEDAANILGDIKFTGPSEKE